MMLTIWIDGVHLKCINSTWTWYQTLLVIADLM